MSKSKNLKRTIPSLFNPTVNQNWSAILDAFGEALDLVVQGVQDANEQLFVETAQEKFLEARGDNYGVRKFSNVLLLDDQFRELIKLLSFRPKQVRETIEDLLELFFGNNPDVMVKEINPNEIVIQMPVTVPVIINRLIGSHHFRSEGGFITDIDTLAKTITINLDANYYDEKTLNSMDHLSDWSSSLSVTGLQLGDGGTIGSKTHLVFDKTGIGDAAGSVILNFTNNKDFSNYKYISFWVNLPDLTNVNVIRLLLSDGVGTNIYTVQPDNFVINQWILVNKDLTNPNSTIGGGADLSSLQSLTIEVLLDNAADVLSNIRVDDINLIVSNTEYETDFFKNKTLKQNDQVFNITSSTAGRTNVVLNVTEAPGSSLANLKKWQKAHIILDNWPGSFLYDPDGNMSFIFSSQTVLDDTITAGDFGNLFNFNDSSAIPDAAGFLVFDFGTDNEEGPVPYLGRPDNSTLTIDPAYQFTKSHNTGAVTILATDAGHEPSDDGLDYAVFNTSIQLPATTAQDEVKKIVAAGVIIRFILITPENSCLFA